MEVVICLIAVALFWVALSAILSTSEAKYVKQLGRGWYTLQKLDEISTPIAKIPVYIVLFVVVPLAFIPWMILGWLWYLIETNENRLYKVTRTYYRGGTSYMIGRPVTKTTYEKHNTELSMFVLTIIALVLVVPWLFGLLDGFLSLIDPIIAGFFEPLFTIK